MALVENADAIREEWLGRLAALIRDIQAWADSLGWSTRQVEISRDDWQIGKYIAPGLLLQHEACRVMLDPIARTAPGAEGVVDLYLMPAFEDIASLHFYDDRWHIHYMFPTEPISDAIYDFKARPLTQESLRKVLDKMKQHAI